MGYIFDALNRSDDEQRRNPAAPNADATPKPTDPVASGEDELGATDDFASLEDLERLEDDAPQDDGPLQNPTADAFASDESKPKPVDPPVASHEADDVDDDADESPAEPLPFAAPPDEPRNRQESRVQTNAPDLRDTPDDNAAPASIPATPLRNIDERLIVATQAASIQAEQYRSIRTTLLARWENRRHLLHTITSATPQEGKTITSLNLGLSFAELRNRRTLVLECDLRLPTIAKLLNLPPAQGITDFLRGQAKESDIFRQVGDTGLTVCCAGSRADTDAVQLLHSQATNELLGRLRERFDHVIIDTPPVVELADAGILGAQSDEVLLVSRMNRTPRTLIEQAISTLQSYHAPVSGMIATDQHRTRRRSYGYRYGYRYGYSYTQPDKHRSRRAA